MSGIVNRCERNMVNYYIPLQKHFSVQNSDGNMCLIKKKILNSTNQDKSCYIY